MRYKCEYESVVQFYNDELCMWDEEARPSKGWLIDVVSDTTDGLLALIVRDDGQLEVQRLRCIRIVEDWVKKDE